MSNQTPNPPQAAENDPTIERLSALLSAPATERELSGLDAAIVGFRAAHVTSLSPSPQRSPSMLSSLTRAKLAATIAAAAVGVGGVAAVAVSASHQPAVTPNAHSTVAATPTAPASASAAADKGAADSGTPVGPDATGSAAYGLCTAWAAQQSGQGKAMDSIALTNLATAAGGADKIAAHCATVTAPGKSGDHPTGKPTDVPTGQPSDAGSSADAGKPADVPTAQPADPGQPSALPTPESTHPTGRP